MKLYKRRLFIAPFYMLHLPQNICFSIINLKSILETKIDRLRFTKKNPLIRNKHFNFTSYADCVRFRSHPKQISIQVTFPFYLPGPMISILRGWRREREHRIYYIYSFFLSKNISTHSFLFSPDPCRVGENIFFLNINFLLAHTNKFTSNQQGRPSVTFDIILSKFYLKKRKKK